MAILEKERVELKEDIANVSEHIGPEAKSYQRLLADLMEQQEKNSNLKKDIEGLKESDVHDKWQTAKSNYVILRRLCYLSPNKYAMLLHQFATLVEKAYAKRIEEFLKFIPGITCLETS